tara:strand:- start:274 stop:1311 length:1038 start_codon:yes stop_codon:yes gene_type:complete
MKLFKIIVYNFLIFFSLIIILETIFGYWFKKENFGIYMRKERKINWQTTSSFYGENYNFFYKRNFWGFRGEEFDPSDVKIVFEGGSTGNQRFTPENLTIVGLLNDKFKNLNHSILIYNASTDGKSVSGYINDFNFWFSKIPNFNPKYVIFYIGINDRFDNFNGRFFLDKKISEKKIDQIKDYIKNNSFIVDKFKTIKNKYFPKNTFAYDLSNNNLYENFNYVDFQSALKLHNNISEKNLILIKNFRAKLNNLKIKIDELNIQPIFINQLMYDGLKDEKLFLINNELKNFAIENKYSIISLDEILIMKKNDFFDTAHTTPQGSKRIADKIFPLLLDFFRENNEIRE